MSDLSSKELNICYCGEYGGGVHTRSARCPLSKQLFTPDPEDYRAGSAPSLDLDKLRRVAVRALDNPIDPSTPRHERDVAVSAEVVIALIDDFNSKLSTAHEPPADAHPEDFCEECKRPNAVWFAPSEVWNVACRDSSILCPVCFIKKSESAGIKPTSWMLAPEGYSAQPPSPEYFDFDRAKALADAIVQKVCDSPEHTSPDDDPQLLLCYAGELENHVISALEIEFERRTGRSCCERPTATKPVGCVAHHGDWNQECGSCIDANGAARSALGEEVK